MHHDLALLITITMAILTALVGGYAARRLGLPTLVGYLIAGMVIGPFTPGFVGDVGAISQLAEMGVIFMMFGVGLHFSLKDLWAVRAIAIPGAIGQMLIATALGFTVTQLWGWSVEASLVLGLSISIASTVVLLRGLEDNGLINSFAGKVAIGWLVLEDLATVAILVLLPALLGSEGNLLVNGGLAAIKAGVFVAIMLFVGARFMPWFLTRIATARSRELFTLSVVALALGTALGAADLFGVSLALGAFLAGVVIGESTVSHQVGAEVLPFREIFSVLFFVSVGMLVNPISIFENIGYVLALTGLIIIGKALITMFLGLFLPGAGSTMVVVAVALSQIGEFSFIVGQAGLALGVLTDEQYGLILAGAVLSIVVNPLLFRALPTIEAMLQRVPSFWDALNRRSAKPKPLAEELDHHVVLVGYGRVGQHIGNVLDHLKIPYLVIEQDAARAAEFQSKGLITLFGNAADSEILKHVGLNHARALVVTVSDEVTTELVVQAARELAPSLPVIARAETSEGVSRLYESGAAHVIHPELEGGLGIVRHTLLVLGFPNLKINRYIDEVRRASYRESASNEQYLEQLIGQAEGMEIAWYTVTGQSSVVGRTLAETNLRSETGASVIALVRDGHVIPNPKSHTIFSSGDLVGLIGTDDELQLVEDILSPSPTTTAAAS